MTFKNYYYRDRLRASNLKGMSRWLLASVIIFVIIDLTLNHSYTKSGCAITFLLMFFTYSSYERFSNRPCFSNTCQISTRKMVAFEYLRLVIDILTFATIILIFFIVYAFIAIGFDKTISSITALFSKSYGIWFIISEGLIILSAMSTLAYVPDKYQWYKDFIIIGILLAVINTIMKNNLQHSGKQIAYGEFNNCLIKNNHNFTVMIVFSTFTLGTIAICIFTSFKFAEKAFHRKQS